MNLKKMWKRFWTLNVHNHEGFTLVELIIVIAILAILSSVAVVGYSSYVQKANAQADRTMISEVKNALELYYYNNSNDVTMGYVIMGEDGVVDSDAVGAAAMEAAYGSKWASVLKLKNSSAYLGTSTAEYGKSSYKGNEDSLLGEVKKLSNALSNSNIDLGSGEFEEMLNGYGYDKNSGAAVGNVATLYVASKTEKQGELIEKTFKANFKAENLGSSAGAQTAFTSTWTQLRGAIGDAAALAAIYAYAEGYAQYYDSLGINNPKGSAVTEFHKTAQFQGVEESQQALGKVILAFGVLYNDFGNDDGNEANPTPLDAYVAEDGMGLANLRAYVSMMGTVVDNKGVVEGNLESEDCFTDGTVGKLLNTYAALSELGVVTQDGQVAVAIVVVDGLPTLHVLPFNME